MKTLTGYIVDDRLYVSDTGPEAVVGDQVQLFLNTEANDDFPESIYGIIQHPIARVNCGSSTSYNIEYDEDDLEGSANFIRPGDVVDAAVMGAVDLVAADLVAETEARIAADAAHEADTTAHPATNIVNTPAGNISATTVQAAINELDSEKSPLAGSSSIVTVGTITAGSWATTGNAEIITTTGDSSLISTGGVGAGVYTNGDYSAITTNGFNSTVNTTGDESHIFTSGTGSDIYTDLGSIRSGGAFTQTGTTANVFNSTVKLKPYTVAQLISIGAATAGAGAKAFATDANATTFMSTLAAGGANFVPVFSNGTNWIIG